MQVLILDQSYSPHRVVGWQRAVCMVFGGKVEVLDEYDEIVRSPSIAMRVPAVVRLLNVARRRPRLVRFSRYNVLLRDGFCCQYCGQTPAASELTVDHVLPRARGGPTHWSNVVAACRICNHRKGSHTPEEAHMPLRRTPHEPKILPSVGERMTLRAMPAQWSVWLHHLQR
jgi:5-methylcytosine-specific restriction endonuclease McrA